MPQSRLTTREGSVACASRAVETGARHAGSVGQSNRPLRPPPRYHHMVRGVPKYMAPHPTMRHRGTDRHPVLAALSVRLTCALAQRTRGGKARRNHPLFIEPDGTMHTVPLRVASEKLPHYREAPIKRQVCVELPEEAREGDKEEMVGFLIKRLYGTRDAAINFRWKSGGS